jgi:type IV secretory pathway protease TraF
VDVGHCSAGARLVLRLGMGRRSAAGETPNGTREALARDHLSCPLSFWHGRGVVAHGDVFLMNRQRYFGSLSVTTIIGRAAPLWTDQEH